MTPRILLIASLCAACAHHTLRAVPDDVTLTEDDHAPHPWAQTELWHVHADLTDPATGEPLHVFAGFVVERTDLDKAGPVPISLVVNPFHAAYVKVQTADRTWVADRSNYPDLFAARFAGDGLDLRHGDWRIAREAGATTLRVAAGPHRLDLVLEPTRPVVLPGDGGRVELVEGSDHLWMQEERMAVTGRWETGGAVRWVEGTGFTKHQWGRIYDESIDGFEWISCDLPGDVSLSIAWLVADGERGAAGSSAWLSTPGGVVPIPPGSLQVAPTRTWRSARSGGRWTVGYRLIADGWLDLAIDTLRDDQELWVFPTALYAGPARARGSIFGLDVDAPAFVESAGARQPPLRKLLRSAEPPAGGAS